MLMSKPAPRGTLYVLRTLLTVGLALLACAALLGAAARFNSARAQGGNGTLRVAPGTATIGVGGIVTVDILLENAENYYGIQLELAYDPNIVQAPSGLVTPQDDLFGPDSYVVESWHHADNNTGMARYAVTRVRPAEPITGSGRICSLTFQGIAPGTSALRLVRATGGTRDGDELVPARIDGEIKVPAYYRTWLPLVLR